LCIESYLPERQFDAYGKTMRRLPAVFSLLIALQPAALGAEPLTIGISAPLSGPFAILGKQITDGAAAAEAALGTDKIKLIVADDKCDPVGGKQAAEVFAQANVSAVVGYLCTPALQGALPLLRERKTPVITLGVRPVKILEDAQKNGDALFRLGPDSGEEETALAELLLPLWRGENFAIIDDGTIHARELAESLRIAAEARGLKPVFVDTFRPALDNQLALVNRLRKSGATHVFVGGERSDIAILARDAAARGVALTIAGGESLSAAPDEVPLADNVLMIGIPQPASAAAGQEGHYFKAHAAVEILAQLASDGELLASAIGAAPHETILGSISFEKNGAQSGNPYRLLVSKSGGFADYP
jgi:branched-chain amino acid transport system substrate-binding protein